MPPMLAVPTSSGCAESRDETFLRGRLDRLSAVTGPYPGDSVGSLVAGQDSQAGQCGPGPSMTAQASHLDDLPCPGPLKDSTECPGRGYGAGRDAKVRPLKVAMVPWWLPAGVEVQAVVRGAGTRVGGDGVK